MAFEQENETILKVHSWAITQVSDRIREPNFELGPWDFPISEFLYRFAMLKRNSPQYNDEEAAAVVYFGMVADQPMPTAEYTDIAIDWDAVDSIAYDKNLVASLAGIEWAQLGPNYYLPLFDDYVMIHNKTKKDGKLYFGIKKDDKGKWQIAFLGKSVRLTRTLKESYEASVYHLNRYLYYNGLYTGIQKTLSEESRRLQGLRAQALASQQAAAKALALSKASENVQEEVVERYEKQLAEAKAKEAEITDYLQKLSRTPEGQGSTSSSGVSGIIPLAIAATVAGFILR